MRNAKTTKPQTGKSWWKLTKEFGFHARSVAWSAISMRPVDYSWQYLKAMKTENPVSATEDDSSTVCAFLTMSWLGIGCILPAIVLGSGLVSPFIMFPVILITAGGSTSLVAWRFVQWDGGNYQKIFDRRIVKAKNRLEQKRSKRVRQLLENKV